VVSANGTMGDHIIFRKSDLKTPPPEGCGDEAAMALLEKARASFAVDGTDAAITGRVAAAQHSTPPRTVEVLLVCDHYVRDNKGGTPQVQAYAIQNANIATQLYARMGYGINMLLVAIHIFEGPEPQGLLTQDDEGIDTYLQRFTNWANTYNGKVSPSFGACAAGETDCFDLSHDEAVMLTGLELSSPIVGLSWIGSICQSNAAAVVENHEEYTWQFAATTLTHEMGHSWGSQHDGDGNQCQSTGNIMASSGCGSCPFQGWQDWSQCTKDYVSTYLAQVESSNDNCLVTSNRDE